MIKVNLLTSFSTGGEASEYVTDPKEQAKLIGGLLLRLFAIFLGPIAFLIYESQTIPELEQKLAAANTGLQETKKFIESKKGIADEIKKYEEEKIKINSQMSFIEKISKDKVNEFKLFQHLQKATPNTVWINKVVLKSKELTISAESDVPADISKFLENLAQTEFLTNISPLNQDVNTNAFGLEVNTTSFNIKAQFNNDGGSPP